MSWEQLVSKKKESLRDSIPQEWRLTPDVLASLTETGNSRLMALDPVRKSGILNELEIEITEKYSAAQLVGRMARGDLKAVEVVTAFCKRAAIAQQLVSETQSTFWRSCF
jgi:amidase